MFDKLFEVISAIWHWFIFWVVIDPYEAGVVIQLGTYRRTVTGGWWLMCPFGIDTVKYETIVRQTTYLAPQSLTTADNKSVTIAGIVIYRITDIKKFLLEIDDGETDMNNIVYGIISDCVEETKWNNIKGRDFNSRVFRSAKADCEDYCGVEILGVKWSDKATARNIRLWND